MLKQQFEILVALAREGDFGRAARSCGLGLPEMHAILREAELMYGRPLLHKVEAFRGFTPMGQVVLACARKRMGDDGDPLALETDAVEVDSLRALLSRRSVSPARLGRPGPTRQQVDLMLKAALRSPDHGGLLPWRVIDFPNETRAGLAQLFEQEKRRRDPLASTDDLRRARDHATRPPRLLAFVVSPRQRAGVPMREQFLAAGAALGSLLAAAHALGFGAIVLSGDRCFDEALASQLGLGAGEFLAGFVSLGRVLKAPPERPYAEPEAMISTWEPAAKASAGACSPFAGGLAATPPREPT
ncbi:MAG TPA: nitroreductase family protein [Burkholderiaceae bacterium]|nr:nitroreductase family protein [Burkholderiaceae bacterium]